MFRQDWETEIQENKSKNIKIGKKKSKDSASEPTKKTLEPRILKAKEASKAIGSRPLYNPSDSDDD